MAINITLTCIDGEELREHLAPLVGMNSSTTSVERQVAVDLEQQLRDLESSNQQLAKELSDSEAEREDMAKVQDQLAAEIKVLENQLKEAQAAATANAEEVTRQRGRADMHSSKFIEAETEIRRLNRSFDAIAVLVDYDKGSLADAVADALQRAAAPAEAGAAASETISATWSPTPGAPVTITWPNGDTSPGIVKSGPEGGLYWVTYFDQAGITAASGEAQIDAENLSPRAQDATALTPEPEKPQRAPRKKKAKTEEPAADVAPIDREHYAAWKAEQAAFGITEGVDEMEFKRLKDAGVLPPFQRPHPNPAVVAWTEANEAKREAITAGPDVITPDGRWANDLDPAAGERRPAPGEPVRMAHPNPAAPAEVQAATKAIAEFEQLPEAVLEVGALVTVVSHTGAILTGELAYTWEGTDKWEVSLDAGGREVRPANYIRGRAAEPTRAKEPEAALAFGF